jgi:hypothetical protein
MTAPARLMRIAALAPLVQVAREFKVSKHCPVNMEDMGRAMRRPGLLQRADEMFPHAVGHVLAAIGTCMQGGRLVGDRSFAQLHVRFAVCRWLSLHPDVS